MCMSSADSPAMSNIIRDRRRPSSNARRAFSYVGTAEFGVVVYITLLSDPKYDMARVERGASATACDIMERGWRTKGASNNSEGGRVA